MKRYLIFVALGPALGGFVLLLATTYQSGYWTETNAGEIAKLFKVFAVSLQYSYLFGFLPALMICAIDDILFHVRRIGPVLRMLLVGVIAFFLAALNYSSHGADYGLLQFVLYGMVGFIPATISSWLVHKYVDETTPETPPQRVTESR
jgi:glucan phosphoethanolaminetransferase (alkaline phosphatase superfamily)